MRYLLIVFFVMNSAISYAASCAGADNGDTMFFDVFGARMLPTKAGSGCSSSENDVVDGKYLRSQLADSTYRQLKGDDSVGAAEVDFLVFDESEPSSFSLQQISVPDLRKATQVSTLRGHTTIDSSN